MATLLVMFQWGGLTGDMGMPIQNDNTVVQVPLSNLEVHICASVPLTIDTPGWFKVVSHRLGK